MPTRVQRAESLQSVLRLRAVYRTRSPRHSSMRAFHDVDRRETHRVATRCGPHRTRSTSKRHAGNAPRQVHQVVLRRAHHPPLLVRADARRGAANWRLRRARTSTNTSAPSRLAHHEIDLAAAARDIARDEPQPLTLQDTRARALERACRRFWTPALPQKVVDRMRMAQWRLFACALRLMTPLSELAPGPAVSGRRALCRRDADRQCRRHHAARAARARTRRPHRRRRHAQHRRNCLRATASRSRRLPCTSTTSAAPPSA